MYNSRARSYKGSFAVPDNYSGNAFPPGEEISEGEVEVAVESSTVEAEPTVVTPQKSPGVGFNASNLFRGGIGFEELLIIALILLIAQSDNNDDVIVLLALLLFIS